MRDLLRIGLGVFRGPVSGHHARNRLGDGLSVGGEVVSGHPALRRLPRSSLYWVNRGWIIGRPTRLMERHPPASVASVDDSPHADPALVARAASNSPSGTSSTIE